MTREKRAVFALLLVVGMLSLAALACTSDQEWIIPRTATPTPTQTPIPMTTIAAFEIGDSVVIVSDAFQLPQTVLPEADRNNNRVIGGGCFPGTTTEVEEIAQGPDGLIYYRVQCILDGWVPEVNLEAAE